MFGWAVTFLVVALIAAVLGFGGVAGTAMAAAKLVFVVALVAFALSALFGLARRPSRPLKSHCAKRGQLRLGNLLFYVNNSMGAVFRALPPMFLQKQPPTIDRTN